MPKNNNYEIWFVYPNQTTIDGVEEWIQQEASNLDLNVKVINNQDIVIHSNDAIYISNEKYSLPKVAFMRGYFEELSFFFKTNKVQLINDWEFMKTTKNKYVTNLLCDYHGIPTPLTLYSDMETTNFKYLSDTLGIPFVIKDNFGSQGELVFLVNTEEEFDVIRRDHAYNTSFIFQEFIKESKGKDLRVYALGNEIIGIIERFSKTDFRANISQGASSREVETNDKIEKIIKDIIRVFGESFAGVDLLYTKEGYTVCEINGNAGFRGISSVSDVNFMKILLEYVKSRIE